MAIKTISVDVEAYDALCRARISEAESFSQVIKRARWESRGRTGADLLAALRDMPAASDEIIARLDAAQAADTPPDDPRA